MSKFIVAALVLACLSPSSALSATTVGTMGELASAISDANSGGDPEILVENGTYTFTSQWGLQISGDGITVRSLCGQRSAVILEGQGMSNSAVTHIFQVTGNSVTVADMTLCRVGDHAIQIHGELPHNAGGTVLRNCVFQDTGQQMVKVSYRDGEGVGSDKGLVEDCRFEYTAGIGPQWYIGGIDAHAATDWIVRRNEFTGIRSPESSVAEHAIHFWSNSANTLVERNWIVNCDRGIGFGLGSRGHSGGIIRNNMIYHANLGDQADVSIELESAPGAIVIHNTVFQQHSYPAAISARFSASSGVRIENNLVRVNGGSPIWLRDGASAAVSGNVTNAAASWFEDTPAGDLHLKDGTVISVVDQAAPLPEAGYDFDGNARPAGDANDVGAHEYQGTTASPPADQRSWGQVKDLYRS